MMIMRSLYWPLVVLGFILVSYLLIMSPQTETQIIGSGKVIDGDTLQIQEDRFRLKGIDAPERLQTCQSATGIWPCGQAAINLLNALIDHQIIRCRNLEKDQYARHVATCFKNGQDLAKLMVEKGMAVNLGGYEDEETKARQGKFGIWSGDFIRPALWRKQHE